MTVVMRELQLRVTGRRCARRMVVCTRLRKAEVLDLADLEQIVDCSCDIFDKHVWIDAVLIENVYDISLEAFQ